MLRCSFTCSKPVRRRHLCHTDIRAESTQVSGVYSDRELMGTEGMGSAGRAPRGPLKDFGFILTLKETNRGLRAGEDIAWLTSSRKSPCLAARGQWPSWCPQSALFPFKSHFSVKSSCVRSPPVRSLPFKSKGHASLTVPPPPLCLEHGSCAVNVIRRTNK